MSLRLKSRSQFPPGGFQFFQPQTRWKAPYPMADTFDATVRKIIAHRQLNPQHKLSLDYDVVARELEVFNCTRIGGDGHWCDGEYAQKKTPQNGGSSVRAALAGARNLAGGASLLKDWLGAGGKTVGQEQAQSRANVCIECPKNTAGNFLVSKITKAVADAVHAQLRLKHQMQLSVEGEEKLQTCSICLCQTNLKVWVPPQVIKEHTSNKLLAEFPGNCWIPKETL